MCSFFNLFGWGSSDMGVLLTVAMTTERSLAIQFPLKAPTLCTVKRAKIVSFCLLLLEILKVLLNYFALRASLSDFRLLQTLPELVTPLKGHSLSPCSCPPTLPAHP